MKFSVAILVNQYLTREGLKSIIAGNESLILRESQVTSLKGSLELLSKDPPDILIVDFRSGQDQFVDTLDQLGQLNKITKILLISDDQKPEQIKQVIDSGVKGFLTPHCSPEETEHALSAICKGDSFFCQQVVNIVFGQQVGRNPMLMELSQREMEVLTLIGKGLTSQQIADQLFVSIHTINSHRKNLLRKLNMKSPAQLILYAIENLS